VPRFFHKSLTIGPESIDAVGHVNNREYLRWMEEIAVEHSAAQGWPMERYYADRMAWVAASHFIEYLRPALLGEATRCDHVDRAVDRARLPPALRGPA
jgi:acyl-CoA thioester hydrolase